MMLKIKKGGGHELTREAFIRVYMSVKTNKEVAEHFGLTQQKVAQIASILRSMGVDLPSRYKKRTSEYIEDLNDIVKEMKSYKKRKEYKLFNKR